VAKLSAPPSHQSIVELSDYPPAELSNDQEIDIRSIDLPLFLNIPGPMRPACASGLSDELIPLPNRQTISGLTMYASGIMLIYLYFSYKVC
jgi:hypothetical protein